MSHSLPRLFRSVRFRIAVSTSVAVAAVAIITLVGVRQTIRWALARELDQVLVEDARELDLVLSELSPGGIEPIADELRRKATGHLQHRWFARLLAEDGAVIWQSTTAEDVPSPSGTADDANPATLLDYRLYRAAAPANALSITSFEVGSSLLPMKADFRRIDQTLIGASLLMGLVAPLCCYALAGLATREIAGMTTQAASMRPSQLDERLPESGFDDEFDRLAKTVNGLLDRIAEFIREKRTFLANAAHELRTPIAAIRSSIEVALGAERSNAEYKELLEQLIEDSECLEVLVNQVLLLSEAVAAQDAPPEGVVPLSEVVLRAVDMFGGVAESRVINIDSRVAPGVSVKGTQRHLGQVANNLIDNALKYTPDAGHVEVRLTCSGGEVELLVSDNGIGIAPEDVPLVFDRFFRADRARSRSATRGAGLGLSICKTIVEAHRGRIECASVVGKGTRFTVRIPLEDVFVARVHPRAQSH